MYVLITNSVYLGFMTYSLLKGWNKIEKNKDLLFYFLIKKHGTSCFLHKTVFNVKLMYNHGIKMLKRQVKRVFFFSVLFFCTSIFLLVAEPLIARRPEVKTYSYTIFSGTLFFCILVQRSSCKTKMLINISVTKMMFLIKNKRKDFRCWELNIYNQSTTSFI